MRVCGVACVLHHVSKHACFHCMRAAIIRYVQHCWIPTCTVCLEPIWAEILLQLRLPTSLLSLSSVQPPPPPLCQAKARAGGVPSPPAPYAKEHDKRHCLPPPTVRSRVCLPLLRALCLYLCFCQWRPGCAVLAGTLSRAHRASSKATRLFLEM